MQETVAQRLMRYRLNAWDFLMECCYTRDQVDFNTPIKLLPNREYARYYIKILQECPLVAVPKTRRMTCSWFTISFLLWDTVFHSGRFTAFVSKKEEDSAELVKRALFIYEHIPEDKWPKELRPAYTSKFCELSFPELESKIQGFAQGADQLRQFTFSSIFGDECAFWDYAKEFYSASFPTIEGGGRMILVSSPAPGFFKQLVFDALDQPTDVNVADVALNDVRLMEGMRTWVNRKNRFMVVELHYTADPNKRSPEFRESIKSGMPVQDYLREYELYWDTFKGFPVYPEFNKQFHVTKDEPHPMAGIPMLVGIDFGLTPAAIIAQMQEDRLVVFEEMVEVNMGSDRFAEKLYRHIQLKYPSHSDLRKSWLCFIDPAGLQRNQKDETACAQSLSNVGFVPAPGPVLFEERRKAVVDYLQTLTPKGASLQISDKGCPMLIKGFEGGYQYAEKAGDIEPTKLRPLKNAYSHPHDGFQYLCCGVAHIVKQYKRAIPKPVYSLNKRKDMQRHG